MHWNYRIVVEPTRVSVREVRYDDLGGTREMSEPIVLERNTNVKALIAQLNLIMEDIKSFPPIDERPKNHCLEEVPI